MILKLTVGCALVIMFVMVLVSQYTNCPSVSGKGTKEIGFVKNLPDTHQITQTFLVMPNPNLKAETNISKIVEAVNGLDSKGDAKFDTLKWARGNPIGNLFATFCVLSFLGNISAILIILLRIGLAGWEDFLLFNLAIVDILLFVWRYAIFTSAAFKDLLNFGESGISS